MAKSNYQVLARKWRPQKFDQVVGQQAIVRTLSNALEQDRLAHAYCFSGMRGVGKTTMARLLAKGLNCRSFESPTASPCGECEACVEIEESRNLDVVEMDAASQTGVDDIRQLNEFARYTPSRDRYRVFIIDEAHMLSASAFNALLKTLEEPPGHVVFMLATTEPHKILPTVLSRCQHYPLGRISQADISARLREIVDAEQVAVSADGLAMVAMAADGSLRDAQSLLDKVIAFGGNEIDDETVVGLLGMVDRELLFTVGDLLSQQDLAGVLGFVNRMVEQGVDLHQFLLDLLGHVRALLVVATVADPGEILHLPDGDLDRLGEQSQGFAVDDLDRAFALLSASEYRIKQSEVPRYELEMVLSRLARMPRLEPIESLIAQLRDGSGSAGGSAPRGGGGGGRRVAGGSSGRSTAPRATSSSSSRPAAAPQPPQPGRSSKPAANVATDEAPPRPASAEPEKRPAQSSRAAEPQKPSGARQSASSADEDAFNAAAAAIEEPDHGGAGEVPAASATPPTAAPPGKLSGQDAASATLSTSAGSGSEVRIIIDRIRADKPIIARIVERADTTELRDDTLYLTFDQVSPIFRARLQDRTALASIEAVAEAALGRKIKVVAGFGDGAGGETTTAEVSAMDAQAPAEPDGAAQHKKDELWSRAEAEPLVQLFVDALRGNLTDVEEI